jgi:4-amino-4-deoxy-L-arabinose transferase-like glycosyltransferase
VLLGAAARFYGLGTLPPGLYHDEAYNGLDALRVLEGERPIFFEANNGREPFFLYGMAVAMSYLGRTPYAVRVTAAVLGTLSVPATFLMARAMFDRYVGLWSAWWMAIAPWPINLSRIGLRAVGMPLIVALALWAWWAGRRWKGWRQIALVSLGGALLGLSLYTYTAARFVLPAVAIYVLYQTWVRREPLGRTELICLLLSAALVMAPLAAYAVLHWESFAERSAQVSVFNPAIGGSNPWAMLARNVFRAAGLYTVRGDRILRHNVPLRPLFDLLTSVFFLLGVLLCLVRAKIGGAYVLALIWTAVMMIPTILAEDCPHFLRAVGVLPMAAVFPALGLEWTRTRLYDRLQGRSLGWVGNLAAGLVLVVSASWGLYDYFARHAGNPELAYAFESDQVHEAVEINRFLGTGWQGKGAREDTGAWIPGRHVYLGPRMWEDRHSVNLLVASPERISILGRDPPPEAETHEVLVLAWPFGDLDEVSEVFPRPAEIAVWPGPLERGDLDAEPRLLYIAFRAAQLDTLAEVGPAIAGFEEGIELLDWEVNPAGEEQTLLRLRWRATDPLLTDYNVFAHVVRDDQVIAQDDGTPGRGYYPTTRWKPGDEFVDEHELHASYDPQRDQIVVGWYEWSSMRHLNIISGETGQSGQDRLVLQSPTE